MTVEQTRHIRVFLVDDHVLFRSGVRGELGTRVHVVGEAGDVDGALQGIRATRPDVVLLDVHLPGGGGVAVLDAVTGELPDVRALALSVSDAPADVIAVIRAGARGYVTKSIDADALVDAVARVHAGDAVFSPRLAGFVLDAFAGALPHGAVADEELDLLTLREKEVLRHLARGYTYREIAGRLHLSNRHELAAWALGRDLL